MVCTETLAKKGPAKKTPVKGKTATPAGATPSPAKAAASSSKAPPSGQFANFVDLCILVST